MKATILVGDVLTRIKEIPDQTVQCVVTSPPYWGLRDYGHDGQLGLEPTPEAYVENMVAVFREIRRILKDDGVLWLNLGDSYGNPSAGRNDGNHRADGRPGGMSFKAIGTTKHTGNSVKPKDLVGIPWRVAFALQTDGWWLRQDIIWHKPNPMPESVTDRCTKAHEYLFMLTKSSRYYFDNEAIKEPSTGQTGQAATFFREGKMGGRDPSRGENVFSDPNRLDNGKRNKRSVWTIVTKPFKGAHFAVMPEALCEPPILATSRPDDLVFDPFTGSGTVATVALRHGRNYLGIELNPDYTQIAINRIQNDQPMLNETEIA